MFALDWRFLPVFDRLDPAMAYRGEYDIGLVVTSLLIAILAAFVALSISSRIIAATSQRARTAWATAGAISMGGGIWSMHFIGMLAFSLPCGISYNPLGTGLSMIPGMLASGIALSAISKPGEPELKRLIVSAVLMGGGIGAMHYSGMAAMRPEALLRYDVGLVGLSIVVAVVLAFIALIIRFQHHRISGTPATILAATVMGFAVAGMHYTAMQASVFFPLPDAPVATMQVSTQLLALLITIFTVLIATSTLVATFAGRQNELAVSLRAEIARRKDIEGDLVRAREQAEAANDAKSQFLAVMSHEIRTPLNGVLGMANLLASSSLNERQRRLVENLFRSGRALLATINDILDFSKIEAGRFELFDVDFDPREVAAEVTDLFCESCSAKGVEFVYFISEDVPSQLHGDPVRLRQVMINLVGNAIKFTDTGEILVEIAIAEQNDKTVTLGVSVKDTGIGIPAEQLSRVFESFYQADHTSTRAHGGSGLGLTIARHLVEMLGGMISADSAPGRGSVFKFTAAFRRVPLADADVTRERRRIDAPLRVLLVDTNAVSARVISLYLASWGLDTTVRHTAAEAEDAWRLSTAAGRPFEVAIIDVKGLGAAGVALIRNIRQDGRARPADVIALVGIDSFFADDTLQKFGLFATLTKPARPSELFNCLAALSSGAPERNVIPFFMRRNARAKRAQFDAHVLIVEDNPINQEVAVGMLQAMGCRTTTAAHGQAALQFHAEGRFDLILMDCEMPVMDGFETARRVREREQPGVGVTARTRTPIVAITAHALSAVKERCRAVGMDDFLVKPFDDLQLAETLRRWLPSRERLPITDQPATPPANASIDKSVTDQIRNLSGNGNAALLQRVVAQFLAHAPPLVARIQAKAGEGDMDEAWRAAHSLKSSAAAIGARALANRCGEIEALARAGDLSTVKDLVAGLEGDLAAATQSLKELT
jgi:two-component system sensor histidine kinase/response regulator